MSDQWTPRLSEYVDGELEPAERQRLEAHLAGCEECRETVEELRLVVAQAGALTDRPPRAELWTGIARRIRGVGAVDLTEHRARRRVQLSIPQLLAAGVALAAVGAGTMWLAQPEAPMAGGPSPAEQPAGFTVAGMPVSFTATDSGFDAAVGDLMHVMELHRGQLDTSTVRVIEESLAAIDQAIAEARAALAADPANAYLHAHLTKTMRHKLHLLRQAAAIAAMS
jgi:anti-sigma factor RsiW